MPCHSPTKARVIFSLTRVVPSAAMEMVSLKSVTRQLRTWAVAGTTSSAAIKSKSKSKSKGFTTGDTGDTGEYREQTRTAVSDGAIAGAACLEFHRYWFAIGGSGFEELFLLEAEHPGQNVGRERLNLGVQVANDGIVVAAGVLNGVLDFAERILQLREFLRRLELGIILGYGKQAFERAGQLILGGSLVGRAGGLHGHGAEFRDVFKRTFFVGGVAFHSFDQIWNQVVAAFELNVDVGPG